MRSVPRARVVPAPGLRVLIVEDSPPIAQIFAILLKHLGHEAQIASTGAAALEMLPDFKPEIIFSDISMPGMTGYQLAEQIRRQPQFANIWLVAMTGYGQSEDRQQALQAGFDEHLVKPAELPQLEALFAHVQARREAR